MNHNSGIYKILNITNGKMYVGSSKNVYNRIITHKSRLRNSVHCNSHLQAAYNKYGQDSFVFETILICDIINLLYYEQIIIDKLKPEYNISKFAISPMKDRKHTEKTKELMRSYHTPERKYPGFEYSWSHPHNKGKITPKETRDKIRLSLQGKKHSVERREKQSLGQLGYVHYTKKLLGILISPKGIEFMNVDNLCKFGRDNNIDKRRLSEFRTGKRTSWRGWRYLCGN